MVIHVVRLSVPRLVPFRVPLLPLALLFPLLHEPDLNLFLHVVDVKAIIHWHSAN